MRPKRGKTKRNTTQRKDGEPPTERDTTTTTGAGETPTTTTRTAGTPTGETPTTPPSGETPPWGDDFNPERAWRTIQTLRQVETDFNALKKQVDADAEAKKKADEEALAEQEQFKELADQRATEIAELQPQAESAERYRKALEEHLATLTADLPAHVSELLTKMDIVDQLEYLTKHGEALLTPTAEGVPETPRGNGSEETSVDLADDYIRRTYSRPQTN